VWVTKKDLTCVSSNRGGWWQAEDVGDKKKFPPSAFRATEEVGGRQKVWVSGRQRVWVTKKDTSTRILSDGGGLVAGRESG
jgi:hypothetical protein